MKNTFKHYAIFLRGWGWINFKINPGPNDEVNIIWNFTIWWLYASLFNIFERKRNPYRRNTPKNMEKTWKFGALYPIEVIKSQFINSKTLHIILILCKNTIQKKVITLHPRLQENKKMRIILMRTWTVLGRVKYIILCIHIHEHVRKALEKVSVWTQRVFDISYEKRIKIYVFKNEKKLSSNLQCYLIYIVSWH